MRQALEAQVGGFAFLPVDAVVFGVVAFGDVRQRQIGQAQQHFVYAGLGGLGAGLEFVDLPAKGSHLLDDFGRRGVPGGAGVADFPVDLVALVA